MKHRPSVLSGITFLAGLFLSTLAFQNCNKVQFAQEANLASILGDGDGGGLVCVPKDDSLTAGPIKVLFIMDVSGSDQQGDNGGGGTDIGKVWRSKVINDFLAKYGANSKISYGLASFSDTAKAHINDSGKPGFTNNISTVQAAVADFEARNDSGGTQYHTAFDLAKEAIANDQALHPDATAVYAVGFLSDGFAKDYNISTQNGLDKLNSDVKAVLNVNPSKVSMSSVFYYSGNTPDPDGQAMMKEVATAGKGLAAIANANQSFSIENTLIVPGVVCQ
jgi:hypothetical protein